MGICVWFNYRNTRSISQDEQTGNTVKKELFSLKYASIKKKQSEKTFSEMEKTLVNK